MRKIIFTIIITLVNTMVYAQDPGVVKGFVYEQANGEPLSYAGITLKGTKYNGQSDANGFFSLGKVKPGNYTLVVNFTGFDKNEQEIEVKERDVLNLKVMMVKSTNKVKEIVVTAKKQEKTLDTRVGMQKITTKEIKSLPSIGGEPDIAQYLQVMPGVTFTGDQGGQLYIRGGSPVQNKILLDGMTIYNPFHSIGLFSVFETEGIRNAEVMSGGFGVEYGDRTSAIVSINTKDGNKYAHGGKVGISPILAKLYLEGPILKPKTINDASITYVLSAKESFLSRSSNLYKGFGEAYKNGLPFDFTDLYGKVSINSGTGTKFNLFGFNFDDRVNNPTSKLNWTNGGVGSNFVISLPGASNLVTGGFNYSNYNIKLDEADGRPRTSKISGFDANLAVTSFFENNSELKYGVEVMGFRTLYEFYNFNSIKSDQDENTTQAGMFVKYKANIKNKFIFEPGVRVQYYASLGIFSPEPRVAFKYNASKSFRIKGALGRYSQNLISSKTDRDIVNLFTGFLTGPDVDLKKIGSSTPDNNNIQYANHAVGGVELDIKNVELVLEPWFKDFRQLIAFNRYKQFANEPDFLVEQGKAYGLDLTVKYTKDKWYIYNVFSLGKITRFDGVQNYPPPFDRRININSVVMYTTGKNKNTELSARLNYGSAFPFTKTQAIYENINFSNNGLNTNYLNQNGTIDILYDQTINGGRLSDYHRLDVSAKRKFTLTKKVILDVTAGATNAYNRQNIFYINRITNSRSYQLPFFPTVAMGCTF
jgi:hypothetical protein